MAAELTILTLAAFLLIVQIFLVPALSRDQVPPGWSATSRDVAVTLTGRAGRAERALRNFLEALVLYIIAVVVLTIGDHTSGLTGILAWVWLGARVLYVPAYIYGLAPLRSLIWAIGFLATIALLIIALI